MIKKITEFLSNISSYIIVVFITIVVGLSGYFYYESVKTPPDLQDFSGGIQNHLVWSVTGECFFIRPVSNQTAYLIRVKDCDKLK
jgi:hypothetical protein